MSTINIAFTAPIAIDPRTAPTSRIRTAHILFDGEAVIADVEYLDSNGEVIFSEQQRFAGAGVTTWVNQQKATLGNLVLQRKSTTGTVT